MRDLTFSKQALRILTRMPKNTASLIRGKLDEYAADPSSLQNNVKALRGEPDVLRCALATGACCSRTPDR